MAKSNSARPIRMDQFKKQLEDTGIGILQKVELGPGNIVELRLGINLDSEPDDEFLTKVRSAENPTEMALLVLQPDETHDAEQQLQRVLEAGFTAGELGALWAAATAEQQEALGKLRPRRS